MKNNRIQYLLEGYLNNICTTEEFDELLQLLEQYNDQDLDEVLHKIWEAKRGGQVTQVDWEQMLANIKQSQPSATNIRVRPIRRWYRYAVAAIALVALSVGYYFWSPLAIRQESMVEASVPIIERDTILLADGSRVILNAGSTLRYPRSFNGEIREVHLEGEGYFEVTHNPDKPFIVYAGELKTKVLGTSFNINAYTGQSKAEVTVITGKVEVEEVRSGRRVVLLPKEKMQYMHADDAIRKVEKVNVEQTVVWNAGRLAFDDAPLSDIVLQYYRRFGKPVEIQGDNLKKCHLSMVFNQESPEEILEIITVLTNAKLKEENGRLILYGKGCP